MAEPRKKGKGPSFVVCGLPFRYFIVFFAIVLIATYCGFLPTKSIGGSEGSTFVGTLAYLLAFGGLFFWIGSKVPVLNTYLGLPLVLPLFAGSAMVFFNLIPDAMLNGVNVLMGAGFQDIFISLVMVGSILMMNRGTILRSIVRFFPAMLAAQALGLLCAVAGGTLVGLDVREALFNVAAPCMSGGSIGAIASLPEMYSQFAGTDMGGVAGKFLCYASIANMLCILISTILAGATKGMAKFNGGGKFLKSEGEGVVREEEEKRAGTSDDYKRLASGLFISFSIYLAGNVLGNLPGLSTIPSLAWVIVIAIIVKCANLLPSQYEDNAIYGMNFAMKALLPILIFGIGINSLKFAMIAEFFTPAALFVIFLALAGAFVGAALVGHLVGFYGFEAGVSAGLCGCNIGSSGDIATLSSIERMNLFPFASISTRVGGGLMIVWIGLLWPLLH